MNYNSAVTFIGRAVHSRGSRGALVCAAAALFLLAPPRFATAQAPSTFAARVAALSEPGGYFDTDNLISNERSYLQVIPQLRRGGVRGGAYLGVGPDTNFSYIAEVRPAIAFIIDVRRDNLLLHLLFKALFELSRTRVEYLALLLGRNVPPDLDRWRSAPIDRIVGYFDEAPRIQDAAALRRRVDAAIRRTRVPLSAEDFATLDRFHRRFMDAGLDLRFNTIGRPPQGYYPMYRDLLIQTDSAGQQTNYLASEKAFEFLKSLQARDLIIPVTGDLSGPTAMAAIARLLAARRQHLSAFYTSNVEYYLYRDAAYPRFIANLRQIPRAEHSVIIRAVFDRFNPAIRTGDASSSRLQAVKDLLSGFADGRFRSYGQLVAQH